MRALLYKDLVVHRGKPSWWGCGRLACLLPAWLPMEGMLLPLVFGLTLPLLLFQQEAKEGWYQLVSQLPSPPDGGGRAVPGNRPALPVDGRVLGWARPVSLPPGVGELPGRRGIGGSHPADFARRGPSSPVCLRAGGNPLRPVGHHGPGRCGVVAGHFPRRGRLLRAGRPPSARFWSGGSPVPGFAAHRGGAVCPPGVVRVV